MEFEGKGAWEWAYEGVLLYVIVPLVELGGSSCGAYFEWV
jgi:hypothetical protein